MSNAVYRTKQREIIEKFLRENSNTHFTVDSLCALLEKEGNSVGRTTVYRCLERLSQEGQLRKYTQAAGESSCYQYIAYGSDCHEHFHLKCEKCGKLLHIECEQLGELGDHIKSHHNFVVNPLKTVLYGVCQRCSEE